MLKLIQYGEPCLLWFLFSVQCLFQSLLDDSLSWTSINWKRFSTQKYSREPIRTLLTRTWRNERRIGWSYRAVAPIRFIPTILLNLHLQQIPNPYPPSQPRQMGFPLVHSQHKLNPMVGYGVQDRQKYTA